MEVFRIGDSVVGKTVKFFNWTGIVIETDNSKNRRKFKISWQNGQDIWVFANAIKKGSISSNTSSFLHQFEEVQNVSETSSDTDDFNSVATVDTAESEELVEEIVK